MHYIYIPVFSLLIVVVEGFFLGGGLSGGSKGVRRLNPPQILFSFFIFGQFEHSYGPAFSRTPPPSIIPGSTPGFYCFCVVRFLVPDM